MLPSAQDFVSSVGKIHSCHDLFFVVSNGPINRALFPYDR